jgi:hypothetical protein
MRDYVPLIDTYMDTMDTAGRRALTTLMDLGWPGKRHTLPGPGLPSSGAVEEHDQMTYLAGIYVGDPFRFCRGDQPGHRHPHFRHINVTHGLRQLEWTLSECVQRVTEQGRFEAQLEHERYILVRTPDAKLWQEHGPYYAEDEDGNLVVQPDPLSSRYGLTPQGVLQLCVLSSPPFRPVEDPLMADVRPAVTRSRRKPRPCIDRPRLVEALADALFWYERSIHALEDQPMVQRRLGWSPITRLLSDHFDVLADDIEGTLDIYRGKAPLPQGFDRDWLEGVLRVYPQLKTLSRKDVRTWLALAPAIAHLLQTVPAIAYAKLPWPNRPSARSDIDLELGNLLRQILFDSYDDEVQDAREQALKLDQEALHILEQWRDRGILEQWLDRGEEAFLREIAHIRKITGHSSPAPRKRRVPRRERFKGHLNALRLILYQGTWPRQAIGDTPLYEALLLRMREAFLRYGSARWPDTFIEHVMVKILQQVGLEDLSQSELIVDRLRKRLERFEDNLQAAVRALEERRRH